MWVISHNIHGERNFPILLNALESGGIDYRVVKTVPFTDKMVEPNFDSFGFSSNVDSLPEVHIDPNQKIWVMGAYGLVMRANKFGWKPGGFLDNLDYVTWSARWEKRHLLNPDAYVCRLAELSTTAPKFIRPVADSKVFAGEVFDVQKWAEFRDYFKDSLGGPVTGDTLVCASDPVEIYSENRFFVIEKRIATYSQYVLGGQINYSPKVDSDIIEFCEARISEWTPNPAFVIDIARTTDGLKVIELNCLNAAGLYASDTSRLVQVIQETFMEN